MEQLGGVVAAERGGRVLASHADHGLEDRDTAFGQHQHEIIESDLDVEVVAGEENVGAADPADVPVGSGGQEHPVVLKPIELLDEKDERAAARDRVVEGEEDVVATRGGGDGDRRDDRFSDE